MTDDEFAALKMVRVAPKLRKKLPEGWDERRLSLALQSLAKHGFVDNAHPDKPMRQITINAAGRKALRDMK